MDCLQTSARRRHLKTAAGTFGGLFEIEDATGSDSDSETYDARED